MRLFIFAVILIARGKPGFSPWLAVHAVQAHPGAVGLLWQSILGKMLLAGEARSSLVT